MGHTPLIFLKLKPPSGGESSGQLDYICDSDGKTLSVKLSSTDLSRYLSFRARLISLGNAHFSLIKHLTEMLHSKMFTHMRLSN